jgi:hypothetical protein
VPVKFGKMNKRNRQVEDRRMQRRILVATCCLLPLTVIANPVMIDGTSLLAFVIVAFWAFVVEAAVVSLLLAFRGLQPLRIFMVYFLVKVAVFLFLFQPLLEHNWPIPILELLVVCINGLVIKTLVGFEALQSDNYSGLSWLGASAISLSGNAASYFIGLIASRKPWEVG